MVKVNANEPILIFYYTHDCINPVAIEKRKLETVKVKLLEVLYLPIVHASVLARNIISTNTYATILIHVFLILLFSVEHVSICAIPLICHTVNIGSRTNFFRYSFVEYPIEKSDPSASQ
jgi:hypothetical protein